MKTNHMELFRVVAAALPLLFVSAATADELFNTNEAELIEILKTGEPAEKAIACKKLAVFGTKDSVPLLGAVARRRATCLVGADCAGGDR